MHHPTHGTLLLLLIVAKHSRNTSSPGIVSIAVHHSCAIVLYCHNVTMKHELGGAMLVQRDAVPMSQPFSLTSTHMVDQDIPWMHFLDPPKAEAQGTFSPEDCPCG